MYLDSAIIVKLLVREPDSGWFEQKLSGHRFESSELVLTEFCGALLFKERAGDITSHERIRAMQDFISMIENEIVLLRPLNRGVLDRARSIQVACHPHVPLRTLDALHVATCDLHQGGHMCATDKRIRAACKQLGIALVPDKIEDITVS